MLKKIFMILGVALVVFLIVAALQPDTYTYSRSTVINAPASAVFPYLNDMHKGETWSPWVGIDPNMKMTYDGPQAGVGANYHWVGNNQVGEGQATIVESKADNTVKQKLEFIKPFQGTSDIEYNLAQEGDKTTVTWTMTGKNNFIGKIMSLVMNCEKMMDAQFDKGLSKLKLVVESSK
jgi:hypothetical protein